MNECTLFLIRHGQTSWNAENRLQGQIDIPLNEVGIAEAHLVAEELRDLPIKAVYASPLGRAFETARIVNAPHQHEIKIRTDLREAAYGSREGMQRHEFADKSTEFQKLEKEQRLTFKYCPLAESYLEVYERAKPVLDEIVAAHPGQHVVAVTHGGLMRAVIAMVAEVDVRNVRVQNIGVVKLIGDGVRLSLHDYKRVEIV